MAFNERHHPQLGMFSILIKEARRNAQLATDFPEPSLPEFLGPNALQELVRKLARQGPNRIHVSPNGLVTRSLMWQGTDFRYEAYIETTDLGTPKSPHDTHPTIGKEWLVAATPRDIEREISFWGTRHGTTGDLLLKPDAVLESTRWEGDIVHILGAENAYCRYIVSSMRGIRVVGLGFGDFRTHPSENFRSLPEIPPQTRAYANPFAA